jgi:hypothetical protein
VGISCALRFAIPLQLLGQVMQTEVESRSIELLNDHFARGTGCQSLNDPWQQRTKLSCFGRQGLAVCQKQTQFFDVRFVVHD